MHLRSWEIEVLYGVYKKLYIENKAFLSEAKQAPKKALEIRLKNILLWSS